MDYLNCIKAFEVNKHGLLKLYKFHLHDNCFCNYFVEDFLVVTKPLKGEEINIHS